ncbi:MAG: ATP-binding protein [Cyanobacteria bacterium P01_G01_bin.49]
MTFTSMIKRLENVNAENLDIPTTENLIKILIVDDDEVDRMMVCRSLKKTGIRIKVIEQKNGIDAIECLKNETFHCIFLDYRLPDYNGLSLVKKLQSLDIDTPIIILTGQGDEQLAVEIMKAGASDYLSKAKVSPETLSQIIRNAIRVYQAEKEVERANKELRETNKILKQKNQELELKQKQIAFKNQELQKSSQLKSQFLATISHELRTPMNAIMWFSQMLLNQYPDPLTEPQMDMMQRIYNNGKHLLHMINEVLDFSKIEAGKFNLSLSKFDLTNLVNLTIDELKSLAESKGIDLKITSNITNPIIINDKNCLRRILINLVSNAIKFTDEGKVEITIEEMTTQQLTIIVKDTGIGIADEEIPYIFEAFRQGDRNLTRKHTGTGLGLAITESLSKMIQGNIEVASQLGKGSQFTLTIPREITQKLEHELL